MISHIFPPKPKQNFPLPAGGRMSPTNPDGAPANSSEEHRLRSNPNNDHKPDSYEDLQLEYKAAIFSSLERHLPSNMLGASKETKAQYMKDIIAKYLPDSERLRVHKHQEYRQRIMTNYQPLHKMLYNMQPAAFFVPAFLNAISQNKEESFRSIIQELAPGIFAFPMLQPNFCEMLLAEIENFEKWVNQTGYRMMKPNTMNKYGAVLDDFGLEAMLNKLVDDFISPISRVFFPEVAASSLDSHHGFVVQYGDGKDTSLGFHVDDSEVTLNVCLGKQFSGGELFFRGVRCDMHVNLDAFPEEKFDYGHVPGHAILHRGRHRHGARAVTSGQRISLLLWCRSSVFREMLRYRKDFSSWCGQCMREKEDRQRQIVAKAKKELLRGQESLP